ncbi:MAG: putative vancomycin resistance protein, partial [Modestobacter sp.]|nr:putative vancomycin resistance protein [Modestobacter sp.]
TTSPPAGPPASGAPEQSPAPGAEGPRSGDPTPVEVTAALPVTADVPVDQAGSPPSGSDGPLSPGDPDPGDPGGVAAPAAAAAGPRWRHRAVLVPAAAAVALAAVYGLDLLAAGGDVPRHTVVAGVDIGGLSPAAAADRLTARLGPRIAADHTLVAGDVQGVLHPPAAGISLDAPGTVAVAAQQPLNPWTRLVTLVGDRAVDPVLTSDGTAMAAQLEQFAGTVDRAAVDATIALDGTSAGVVPPVDGRTLDRDGAAAAITHALSGGGAPTTPIQLPVDVAPVRVRADAAQRVLDATVTPALSAPVTVIGAEGGDSVDVPVTAIAAALTFSPQDDGTLAVALDPAALQTSMGEEFAVFGSPAEDARFQISGGAVRVVPSVDGQGINPTELAGQLLPVLDDPAPRSVTATLGPVPAAFTTEQAQALGVTEKVSSFSTNFTSSASGTNIRVVAEKVDGAVVRPGETFSLNGYTGPRGTAQGYVPAAVISGGELSQAVGGGISQFATTMFNAVFFAGLEDVHHKPHSFYISRYPAGREATVYEGLIDLQWRNDTDTGIYVQTEWVPGTLTVTFWGTKHYDIDSVSGERRNIRQPAVQDKVDDGNCTPQSGSLGFDITVTRVFKNPDTGAELRRENFNTHYAAEAVIHCLPPAPVTPDAPAGTPPATPSMPAGRRPGGHRSHGVPHRGPGRRAGRHG